MPFSDDLWSNDQGRTDTTMSTFDAVQLSYIYAKQVNEVFLEILVPAY